MPTRYLVKFAIFALGVVMTAAVLPGCDSNQGRGAGDASSGDGSKDSTLSKASRMAVSNLESDIELTLYTSSNLSDALKTVRKDVFKLLKEFSNSADGSIILHEEHPDVENPPEELEMAGITPLSIQEIKDSRKIIGNYYFHILISDGMGSETVLLGVYLSSLEFDITRAILKHANPDTVVIGIFTGNDTVDSSPVDFSFIEQIPQAHYRIEKVDLSSGKPVPEDMTTMLVVNPGVFGVKEQLALDQYIMRGGKVLFLLDTVDINAQGGLDAVPKQTPWADFISHYGLKVGTTLVIDPGSSSQITIRKSTFASPYNYPLFLKVIKDNYGDLAFITNLEFVTFPWASPVECIEENLSRNVDVRYIFHSTDQAYLMHEPFDIDPMQFNSDWSPPETGSEYQLGVIVSGVFQSYFKGRAIPGQIDENGDAEHTWEGDIIRSSEPTELVLIGCSHGFTDKNLTKENAIFLVSLLDCLSLGDGLMLIPAREPYDGSSEIDIGKLFGFDE